MSALEKKNIIDFGEKRLQKECFEFFSIDTNENNLVKVPLFLSSCSAGIPSSSTDDYVEKIIGVHPSIVTNPKSTFAVRVSGESMKPMINDGDLILVDRSLRYSALDQIVVAYLNGGYTVKLLKVINNVLTLIPRNRKFKNICVDKYIEDFEVKGVVIHILKNQKGRKYINIQEFFNE